eukprot:SAG31_NODE_2272_length_6038_cov_37.265196_6_plen_93_part_00
MLKSFAPMFGGMKGLVPKLKPIMVGFVDEVGGVLAEKIDPAHLINVNNVRSMDCVNAGIIQVLSAKIRSITVFTSCHGNLSYEVHAYLKRLA